MEKISKTYRLKKESIEKLEFIRSELEKNLGMKISTTAAIEFLINKYYSDSDFIK